VTSSGIPFTRGSLFDVLDRYYQTAKQAKADVVVRITADCPVIDPELIDAMWSIQ
jgi:spore coat polysaccharide biosynthesis protein SpsF (cytidylyltransferase family)